MNTLKIEYFKSGQDSPFNSKVVYYGDILGGSKAVIDIAIELIEEMEGNQDILFGRFTTDNKKTLIIGVERYTNELIDKTYNVFEHSPFDNASMCFLQRFTIMLEQAYSNRENAKAESLKILDIKENTIKSAFIDSLAWFMHDNVI